MVRPHTQKQQWYSEQRLFLGIKLPTDIPCRSNPTAHGTCTYRRTGRSTQLDTQMAHTKTPTHTCKTKPGRKSNAQEYNVAAVTAVVHHTNRNGKATPENFPRRFATSIIGVLATARGVFRPANFNFPRQDRSKGNELLVAIGNQSLP